MTEEKLEITPDNGITENKMGVAPIGRLLASMAWPAILSMTILALYNVVDSVFVSMVSPKALTAVSIVAPLQMLIVSLGVGSGVGVNSLIARRLGAKRFEEANKAAGTSFKIAAFNYLIFLLVGIFIARPFMSAYTEDAEVFAWGLDYLKIVTMGSLFVMISMQLEKVLQATGNMIGPMIVSLSGAIVNLILDPFLIFGLFGLPKMGVAGAGLATVIGQAVGMCVALYLIKSREHDVEVRINEELDWKIIKDIYAVGLPSIIMQSIGSIMLFGYNAILAGSAAAVAVLGVYFKLQSFVFMPVFGLNQGAMPIMGYNFGARSKKRLMQTYKYGLCSAIVIMSFGFLIFQTCPGLLLKLFNADKEMLEIGIPALRLISLCFIPAAFGIMTSTLFQGIGHGVLSLIGSFLRQLVGILPIAYLLYNYAGVTASWASFPLAEIIGLIYSAALLTFIYKKEIKNL